MTRRLSLALAASVLLALPAPAMAATKKTTKAPVVTKVTPRNAKVGDTLVLTGKNFVKGKGKNVVLFYTRKGGGTFTKAADASTTRLKVVIPAKLANLLPANGAKARILLRVKGKRLGARTSAKISPLVAINPDAAGGGSGGAGGGGTSGTTGGCTPDPANPLSDVDKDLVSDAVERSVLLDACNADSDADGVSDGYEYYSAIDQNSQALPYPWKTPYPNPLFKDAGVDHDGDGLTLADEYSLWTKFGNSQMPLNYSAGKQTTVPTAAPDPSGPLYYLDMNGDGQLTDDERDADGDGLGNWDESHGRMTAEWWKTQYDGTNGVLETPYPVTFGPVDMTDADSEGDGVLDGADDTDFDGLTNAFEVARPGDWGATYVSTAHNFNPTLNSGDFDPSTVGVAEPGYSYFARTNPFNPCKPVWSDKCHLHPPFGYYDPAEDWIGFGRPGSGQVIPAHGARPGDV